MRNKEKAKARKIKVNIYLTLAEKELSEYKLMEEFIKEELDQ